MLNKLLYKSKNQHRGTKPYQKAIAVKRAIKLYKTALLNGGAVMHSDFINEINIRIIEAGKCFSQLLYHHHYVPYSIVFMCVLSRLLYLGERMTSPIAVVKENKVTLQPPIVNIAPAKHVSYDTKLDDKLSKIEVQDIQPIGTKRFLKPVEPKGANPKKKGSYFSILSTLMKM
jgi:hypothetical protein